MNHSMKVVAVAGLALLGTAFGASAASPAERQAYKAALARAASDYQAARAPCQALKGNDRSVCLEEAQAARVRAESLAEASYRHSPRARADADIAIARADYAVAKRRCAASTGDARSACLKAAREIQGRSVEEALKRRDNAR